jgi:hypothetical protein
MNNCQGFLKLILIGLSMLLAACSAKIYGTVELVDPEMKPIEGESVEGTVVNMMNTTAQVENASTSAIVDEKGKFESEKESIVPGTYKVEAARIGYETETETVEIKGSSSKKLEFKLKKIEEGKRRTIESSSTDADKIINPGEVNIRPPGL